MGTIGGGIWHGIKGARNSPKVITFYEESESSLISFSSPAFQLQTRLFTNITFYSIFTLTG